ncbi:hypothetical protein [Lentzea sp.]|uniref:hypothetical protein n=1 Tax=Lentzea sp. TaxID=56099 RepID=UPI002C44AFD4|nr:hypothetical protein [Lentzea sp.]HUQ55787.1 hypothetical protein [Lentzea sp.]
MRALTLYARSRGVPAALVALPVVVFAAWLALRSPWTPLSASLTALAGVLVVTVGLTGQDPELDASTALPWPVWRFGHLLLATALAATAVLGVQLLGVQLLGVQLLGDAPSDVAFFVRDAAGMAGLAGLTATVAGARLAPVAPVLWWAVSAIMPPGESLSWRITTWPTGASDDPVTTWTAAALFAAGIAAYTARGGRR